MKLTPSRSAIFIAISNRFTIPVGALLTAALISSVSATPIPQNMSSSLRGIIEKDATAKMNAQARAKTGQPEIFNYDKLAIKDNSGRVLVNVRLDGSLPLKTVQDRIVALKGNQVTGNNPNYRAGIIEVFVAPAQAAEIANMEGVSAVDLVPRPHNNVGKATTQGIVQHRIDKVPAGINGTGITVGVLSDSYNTHGPIRAKDDVESGDLPGPGNPFGRTQRVEVFQDEPFGGDEGRAILQIVHDIAPEARLGFATANEGEVSFADNIRSLAGLPSGSLSKPNFKADVIIDDVIYFDEPMFQDGIIAQGVDDVAAAGVSYFSSAGNQPSSQAYDAPFRLVKAGVAATAGTNLDFTDVDPNLFKGGFHNFSTTGQDIAQTVHIDFDGIISFQWNEPFDSTPAKLGNVIQSGSGTLTDNSPTESFDFAGNAGEHVAIIADADRSNHNPLRDVTITLLDPKGNEVAFQDATTDPERLVTFLPVTGTYKIVIGGFFGATGDFVYKVRRASGKASVASDFNLLIFSMQGKFLGAIAENNLATNRPIELGILFGVFDFQLVISRANIPPKGALTADHLRYVWFDGGLPQEYVTYKDAATYGHSCAAGASGVAAYAFYPPFIPEGFTSPGPVTIYFDRDNKPLAQPDHRLKPDMAAMDGGNTTFFVSDVPEDDDDLPNFFGTSAAAPHAGGIAALMLQAAGGPGSLTPDVVRSTMQRSTFLHDLDPNSSQATARNATGTVQFSANGDDTNTSSADPNFFRLSYDGQSSLTGLKLNLQQANPTEANPGLVFDTRKSSGFPFTLADLTGVPANAISATFEFPAPPPALKKQFQQLDLSFDRGAFNSGNVIHFGVDRDEADAFGPVGAVGGNSADLLGQSVLIPQGTVAPGGATFSAQLANGETLVGIFTNVIGHGYSQLDGFGFVNAEAAVNAVKK